jgi:hypothetical protein
VRKRGDTIAKAGLFLLFAAVLALLTPLQVSAETSASLRNGASESKSEGSQHRDCEKLRERLPGIPASRRQEIDPKRRPLPNELQNASDTDGYSPLALARGAGRMARPSDECSRSRHSPAALQVYLH